MIPQRTPRVLDLGALRHLGDGDVVDAGAEQAAQRAQRRDLERGARRQADADRHVGRDVDVEGRNGAACTAHLVQAAVDVAGELLLGRAVEREGHDGAEIVRAQREARAGGAADRDGGLLRQRHRQDEAVVVVGVLAQQVDPARRTGERVRLATERGPKARAAHRRLTSMACSSRALSSGSASMA
jgi:hypothetical protein